MSNVSPNTQTKRRAVNLTIRADLLAEAKSLEINASQEAEKGIAAAVKAAKEREWLAQNRDAIEAHNRRVEEEGLFLDPHWITERE